VRTSILKLKVVLLIDMDIDSVVLLFSFGHRTFAEQFQNEFHANSDSVLVLSLHSASDICEGAS
jgi:hypothetical protein